MVPRSRRGTTRNQAFSTLLLFFVYVDVLPKTQRGASKSRGHLLRGQRNEAVCGRCAEAAWSSPSRTSSLRRSADLAHLLESIRRTHVQGVRSLVLQRNASARI